MQKSGMNNQMIEPGFRFKEGRARQTPCQYQLTKGVFYMLDHQFDCNTELGDEKNLGPESLER